MMFHEGGSGYLLSEPLVKHREVSPVEGAARYTITGGDMESELTVQPRKTP